MENLVHILVPLGGCAMIFGIVYIVMTANHRENMAMIAQGMNPKKSSEKKHSKLRLAFLFFLVPIGILIGNKFHEVFGIDPEPAAVVCAFLMGGVALVTTYFIERKLEKSDSE